MLSHTGFFSDELIIAEDCIAPPLQACYLAISLNYIGQSPTLFIG